MPLQISIKAARINADLSQAEFARLLKVSTTTVGNWESGNSAPDAIQFRTISEITNIPMDCIFVPTKSHKKGFEKR